MDDISSEQLEGILDALKANADALTRMTVNTGKFNSGTHAASSKLVADLYSKHSKALDSSVTSIAASLKSVTASADALSTGLKILLKGVIGGAVVAEIIESGEHMFKTYQKLSDVGQTFGGNMIAMGQAAAEAQMPLDEFSHMLLKNSVAAAQLKDGVGQSGISLGKLQLSVKEQIKQFGFFGMSMEDISDLTGDYAETLRLSGSAAYKNKQMMTDQVTQFAKDISEWSAATGVDRKKLAEDTNDTMRNVMLNAVELTNSQQQAMQKIAISLNSIPDGGGKELADGVAETVGALNVGMDVYNTQFGKMLNHGDPSGMLMQQYRALAKKAQMGEKITDDQMDAQRTSNQLYLKQNGERLEQMAMAGDQESAQLLAMLEKDRGFDAVKAKQARKDAETQTKLTKTFESIEFYFNKLIGSFKTGFFESLNKLGDDFDEKNIEETFKSLSVGAKSLGNSLGMLVQPTMDLLTNAVVPLTDEFVKNLTPNTKDFHSFIKDKLVPDMEELGKIVRYVVVPAISGLAGLVMNYLLPALTLVSNGVTSFAGLFTSNKGIAGSIGLATAGILGFVALLTGKRLLGGLISTIAGLPITLAKSLFGFGKNILTKEAVIEAAVVNINGKGGGSSGLSGGGVGGGGGRGAVEAEEAAGAAAAKKPGVLGRVGNFLSKGKGYSAGGGLAGRLVSGVAGSIVANPLFGGVASGGAKMLGAVSEWAGKGGAMAMRLFRSKAASFIGKLLLKSIGPIIAASAAGIEAHKNISEAYANLLAGKISQAEYNKIWFSQISKAVGSTVGAVGGEALGDVTAGPIGGVVAGTVGYEGGSKLGGVAGSSLGGLYNRLTGAATIAKPKAAVPKTPDLAQIQKEIAETKNNILEEGGQRKNGRTTPIPGDETEGKKHTDLLAQLNDNMAKLIALQQQYASQSLQLQKAGNKAIKQNGQ